MDLGGLKDLLRGKDPAFWSSLQKLTCQATEFDELTFLSTLRKRAIALGIARPGGPSSKLRLAILGGYGLYPLHDLLAHVIEAEGTACELLLGDYDNYVAEAMETDGRLYQFQPQVVMILPGPQRCHYPGAMTDQRTSVEAAAGSIVTELLALCKTVHDRTSAEILLCNFMLPTRHDLGAYRSRTLASDWSFRKLVNLELGLTAPSYVRICDLEFLASRAGLAAEDARGWFESKQPCSPALLVDLCREGANLVQGLRRPPKKVLVLDLDNTLWGGVVADDGLEGIEIGDTSPRGEAFKAFQRYLLSLKARGILLAVCSKNDHASAIEPFEKHPEMVLRLEDFVSFKANWAPKSDNLNAMAAELNLAVDSFVFADDNPAEIELVRQLAPAVTTILLGADPAEYVSQVKDCRLFEPRGITGEDALRTAQYHTERQRQVAQASAADMDAYLESLEMVAAISEFAAVDVPRLAQLTNKSNQFNLTTRRRSEAEILTLVDQPGFACFSVRLRDRFGDHGLISVAIGRVDGATMEIDTWLMSCRVLKRQVEETVLNEFCRLAVLKKCARLAGVYLPTRRNDMVRDLYPRLGFRPHAITPERSEYCLELASFQPIPTRIRIAPRP